MSSRVRVYEPDRDGPGYIRDEVISPANAYESCKFGSVSSLMVSKSVIAYFIHSIRKAKTVTRSHNAQASSHQGAQVRHHADVLKV